MGDSLNLTINISIPGVQLNNDSICQYFHSHMGFQIMNSLICAVFFFCYLFIISFVLTHRKVLENAFNIILLNLAVVDLTVLFYDSFQEIPAWKQLACYEPYVWMKAFYFQFVFYSELWHNLVIAFNRTFLILLPHIYERFNKRKYVLVQIAFIWLAAILQSWPISTNYGSWAVKVGSYVAHWEIGQRYEIAELIFAPGSIIISMLLYIFLFIYVHEKHSKAVTNRISQRSAFTDSSTASQKRADNKRKKYMILLQSFYISLTWGCLIFASYSWYIFHSVAVMYYSVKVCGWFAYTSNPLMYTTMGSQFRQIIGEKLSKFRSMFRL